LERSRLAAESIAAVVGQCHRDRVRPRIRVVGRRRLSVNATAGAPKLAAHSNRISHINDP
jgi:hypothetical protein